VSQDDRVRVYDVHMRQLFNQDVTKKQDPKPFDVAVVLQPSVLVPDERANGVDRYLPELASGNPVARNAAERMAMNAPVQGTASDMIKIAMVRVQAALTERGLRARMLLQVHDELLFEAPPDEVAAVEALAREIMAAALPLKVPVVVDVKTGADWAEV